MNTLVIKYDAKIKLRIIAILSASLLQLVSLLPSAFAQILHN
jgi:hypothetical protein